MENLVPLGTGNSRFMKSNIPASTTLAQLIQMLNNGTFPYDIGPINPAGISQQGTPLNKDTLLAALVAQKLGGVETPSEAFDTLRQIILSGKYAFRIKVLTSSGQPVPNLLLNGISDFVTGETAVTDSNGVCIGYSDSANPTISIDSEYVDLSVPNMTPTGAYGVLTDVSMTATLVNFKAFTASASVKFSSLMTRLDASLCGSGSGGGSGGGLRRSGGAGGGSGGGSAGDNDAEESGGGGGGNGGGILVQTNVPFTPNQSYNIVIPSGGKGGAKIYNQAVDGNPGNTGGTCSAFGLSSPASGRSGKNGGDATSNKNGGAGGDGGDAGGANNNQIFSSFTTMKTCGTGGAGGRGGTSSSTDGKAGADGTVPGGGGAGGGGIYYEGSGYRSGAGGDGARGEAAIRMWHGEEAS